MTTPPESSNRDRILLEATRLFADRGYGSTSVREVVEAAEVTKPTMYYYFPSKEALFLQAIQAQVDALRDIVGMAIHRPGTVRERIGAFIASYIEFTQTHVWGMRLLMTAHHRPEDGQPHVDMISVHRRNGELLAELIHEGIANGELRSGFDVRDAVMSLVGMINLRCAAAMNGAPLPPDMADRILDIYLNGVSAR